MSNATPKTSKDIPNENETLDSAVNTDAHASEETTESVTNTKSKDTDTQIPKSSIPDLCEDEDRIFTQNTTNLTGINQLANQAIDQDVLDLRKLPPEDQLWFFLDDVVPTDTRDAEIVTWEDDIDPNGTTHISLTAKSIEIFEEIANIPNHAVSKYPDMVKYFPDIIRLYNTVVKENVNPYWEANMVHPINPMAIGMLLGLQNGQLRGFLTRKPKPNAHNIPIWLTYGDESHKHDFVGMVYLYCVQ